MWYSTKKAMTMSLTFAMLVAISGVFFLVPSPARAEPATNRLLLIDAEQKQVLEYDALNGAFLHTLIPALNDVHSIQDLAIGPDGAIYLSVWTTASGGGTIRRYDRASGNLLDTFITNGRGGLQNPDEIVFTPGGNLYVSDRFSGRILRFNGYTGAYIDTIVDDERLSGFISFALGPEEMIYASMFNPAGSASPATFYNGRQCVLRFNGSTGQYIDAIYCPEAADPDAAASELLFADRYMFVARYHAGQVVQVDLTNRQVVATLGCPGDDRADGIGIGPDGKLYVSNFGNENLRRIDLGNGACQTNFFTGGSPQISGRFVFTGVAEEGRVRPGLLALYDFDEGEGRIIRDSSNVGYALNLTISNPERVTWLDEGLRINEASTLYSTRSARKINEAAKLSNEITIELWITPDPQYLRYSGRLVTISATDLARNVTLTQGLFDQRDPLVISGRIRTSTSGSGSPELNMAFPVPTPATPRHIVYTRSADGTTRIYENGQLKVSGRTTGDLSTWRRDYRLALGNEFTGMRHWLGMFSLVAIYGRALHSDEITHNYAQGSNVP